MTRLAVPVNISEYTVGVVLTNAIIAKLDGTNM
jgi:hypothetical protein